MQGRAPSPIFVSIYIVLSTLGSVASCQIFLFRCLYVLTIYGTVLFSWSLVWSFFTWTLFFSWTADLLEIVSYSCLHSWIGSLGCHWSAGLCLPHIRSTLLWNSSWPEKCLSFWSDYCPSAHVAPRVYALFIARGVSYTPLSKLQTSRKIIKLLK